MQAQSYAKTKSAVFEAGYGILDSNDEGLTDFDEACRIAEEQGRVIILEEYIEQLSLEFTAEFAGYRKDS